MIPPIIRRKEKYAFRLTKESSPLALHQRQGEDYKANASHHSLNDFVIYHSGTRLRHATHDAERARHGGEY